MAFANIELSDFDAHIMDCRSVDQLHATLASVREQLVALGARPPETDSDKFGWTLGDMRNFLAGVKNVTYLQATEQALIRRIKQVQNDIQHLAYLQVMDELARLERHPAPEVEAESARTDSLPF